jgi:4-amino-4-deoxy-L-arabinose transferase-like glycosyltransferase
VTETAAPIAGDPRTTALRVAWAVLILATLYICYFSHLGAIGLAGPDEPRYAWIARDMAETGDWVTPRLYGKPWFEKPPLYYWGAALSFKLFSVSEAAARLPSAVSALLATFALAWLALNLYGAETARWLLLLLPTTVGMMGFSHAAATDMPFSAMLTVAMVSAAVVLGLTRDENSTVIPQTPWLALLLFGFSLGLAVLAKGPAAMFLSGGAVFCWALFTKRWRDAFRLVHPAAIVAFCMTALPWYILCARRNPDFFRIFIIEHNFKRYLTPEFQHIQPFWFYGPIILFGLFPWMGMAISAVMYSLQRKFEMKLNASTIFILGWGGFPLLFFSISKSKLPGYVLPAIPAFVLLAVRALTIGLQMKRAPSPKGFAVLALTPVAFFAAIGVVILVDGKTAALHRYGIACELLAFLAVTAILTFALAEKHRASLVSGVLAWLCFALLTYRMAVPWLDPLASPGPVARNILARPEVAREVTAFFLKRDWRYGLNFYLQRELKDWDGSRASQRYVVTSLAGLTQLKKEKISYQLLDTASPEATLIRIGDLAGEHPQLHSRRTVRCCPVERGDEGQ